jgi:hypothetical protein
MQTDFCVTVAYICSLNSRRVDPKSSGEERKKSDWREFGKKLHGNDEAVVN